MASYWFSRAFIQNFFGAFRQPEKGEQSPVPGRLIPEAGVAVTDERAVMLSAVWSCARVITETVGCLPLGFYKKNKDGTRDVISDEDHYIVHLLKYAPNRQMSPSEFRQAMTLQLCLWGNAYARIAWSGTGPNVRPVGLRPLQPDRMRPYRLDNGDIQYHYHTDDRLMIFDQKDIFHLKIFSTEGIVGLSPLAYARHSLGISIAQEKYAGTTFASGGRPSGVLTFSEFLSAEQREVARKLYQDISNGPENSQNAWVLEGGSKYEPINIPPDDLQMLESRTFQISDIARFFRVPSHMINDTQKSTTWGSGLEQFNRHFIDYTIEPYLTAWEDKIRFSLLSRGEKKSVIVEHNLEGLLRGDSKSRADYYSRMVQNGLMTRNEVRKKENLKPKDGGDDLTVQVNLTPADQLGSIGDSSDGNAQPIAQ